MKKIFITIIAFYQRFISPVFHQLFGITNGCRQIPTCSEYAKDAIEKYGAGKGFILSARRIITCQPFFSL